MDGVIHLYIILLVNLQKGATLRNSYVTYDPRFKDKPSANIGSANHLGTPIEVETWRILSSLQGTARDTVRNEQSHKGGEERHDVKISPRSCDTTGSQAEDSDS